MLTILGAWLLADFISGIAHWYEDRAIVGESRFVFLNSVRADNERHHKMPGFLTRLSYWENINTTAPFVWAIALITWFMGAPTLVWLTLTFLGFGNLVHRFAHEHPDKIPAPIRFLQNTGIFISPEHHAWHHNIDDGEYLKLVAREDSDRNFCVMTNYLNPILDGVGFFKGLEWIRGKM